MIGKAIQAANKSFILAPGTWILAGLLAYTFFLHYQTGRDLNRVCDTISRLVEGYSEVGEGPRFPTGIDINTILVESEKRGALFEADSLDGRAFRWWRSESARVERICSNRTSDFDLDSQ